MKAIVILGGGPLQQPAYNCASEMGIYSVCVDGDESAVCRDFADEFWHIDLKEFKAIANNIQETQLNEKNEYIIKGVFTLATDFSHAVSYIAEECNLPGIPFSQIMAAKDKGIMRASLQSAGINVPDFIVAGKYGDQVVQFMDSRKMCVVKPCDNMGARGVQLVYGASEEAFAEAASHSVNGRVIVEDVIEGNEYSIDSLVWDDEIRICGVADRHIYFSPRFVELGHSLPAELDDADLQKLCSQFKKAVKALGITRGVAKGDVFINTRGDVVIGEIAARLSGGYMSGWTYPAASGINLTAYAMQIALGENPIPEIPADKKGSAVERSVISTPGVLSHIIPPAQIPASSIAYVQVKKGDHLQLPVNNVNKLAHVISSADSMAAAVDGAESLIKQFIFMLEPKNSITEKYLFEKNDANKVYWPHAHLQDNMPGEWFVSASCTREIITIGAVSVVKLSGEPNYEYKDWRYRSIDDILEMLADTIKNDPFASAGIVPGALFWSVCMKAGLEGLIWLYESIEKADNIREQVTLWQDF